MKAYITMDEVMSKQGSGAKSYKFLTAEHGCVNGCCSGMTIYSEHEFSEKCGCHDDQEGFYVLEGEGFARLDDEIFPIAKGDSFIAGAGVRHSVIAKEGCECVKVFWFHSAV